ncbi:hypothetical protein OUZ56_007909 [Daphnia magna]|uniref:Secreted protein n=1 Tax=Daphnia magna TaxID=35525 RepID=A0ABR0ABE8_9CRUS|nr:hypothetical protein OUZ56_007909 [Daphnia magna]
MKFMIVLYLSASHNKVSLRKWSGRRTGATCCVSRVTELISRRGGSAGDYTGTHWLFSHGFQRTSIARDWRLDLIGDDAREH